MKLPLTLPLDSYPARTITVSRQPDAFLYPLVLQIELLHQGEAQALTDWLSSRAAPPAPAAAEIAAVMGATS